MSEDRALRQSMVDGQLRPFDVTDQTLLSAFLEVPRSDFVAPEMKALAYADAALLIAAQSVRRILKPMVIGRMIQSAKIQPGEKILDIASGSGYTAALLARMGGKVTALEHDTASVQIARMQSTRYGFTLVEGAIDRAPTGLGNFDVMIINGAIETEPHALLSSLAEGGRLVTVFGNGPASFIRVTRRTGQDFGQARIVNATAPSLREFAKPAEFVF